MLTCSFIVNGPGFTAAPSIRHCGSTRAMARPIGNVMSTGTTCVYTRMSYGFRGTAARG